MNFKSIARFIKEINIYIYIYIYIYVFFVLFCSVLLCLFCFGLVCLFLSCFCFCCGDKVWIRLDQRLKSGSQPVFS